MFVRAIGRAIAADAHQKAASRFVQRPSLLVPLLSRIFTSPHNRTNGVDGLTNVLRTYATAKKTATTKKKTTRSGGTKRTTKTTKTKSKKKKPAKEAAKTPKRARKELTPEQKLRKRVKSLKQAALLDEPKKLPQSLITVLAVESTIRGFTDRARDISQKHRSLSSAERERYQQVINQNKEANNRAMKRFIESHTPDQIRIANNARVQLNRVHNGEKLKNQKKATVAKRLHKFEDPRVAKRPASTYAAFVSQRFASGDYKGVSFIEASKEIKKDWKNLSPEEKRKMRNDFDILTEAYREQQRKLFPSMKQKTTRS